MTNGTQVDCIELYKQGLTLTQLSSKLGESKDIIRLKLKKAGVYIQTKQHSISLDEHAIVNLYKSDILPTEIARIYNVSTAPIVRILKKHGVRKPVWLKMVPYELSVKVVDKDWFTTQVEIHTSIENIKKSLGLNYDLIASLYKYHNINKTPSSLVRSLINQSSADQPFNFNTFQTLYVDNRTSLEDIASLMKISVGYLRYHISEIWNATHLMRDRQVSNSSIEYNQVKNDKQYFISQLAQNKSIEDIADQLKCWPGSVRTIIKYHKIKLPTQTSIGERQLTEFVKSLGVSVLTSDRKIIYPYELDIVVPSHNIAIEYCGLYWHSDAIRPDKKYHLTKLSKCTTAGLRLIQVFEDEWVNNPTLCKNRIAQALGSFRSEKVAARKCIVREILAADKRRFLDTNHLQGSDIAKINLGLYHEDELVAVMTFARPSRSRNSTAAVTREGLWELNRYATTDKYHVVGGAGKLLAYFKRTYDWAEIYSYADRRWSVGKMYYALGFNHTSNSAPNYWYVPPRCTHREYRFNYTKASLVKLGYDKTKTEEVIMKERNYKRIWDCGVMKFTMLNE